MSAPIGHPKRLLRALDQGLNHNVRLILYGRGAIWLGFNNPPIAAATTQDVDAIIPEAEVKPLADDSDFWDARDQVNDLFKSEGLYITHLFPEGAVFLRRDWMKHHRGDQAAFRTSEADLLMVTLFLDRAVFDLLRPDIAFHVNRLHDGDAGRHDAKQHCVNSNPWTAPRNCQAGE